RHHKSASDITHLPLEGGGRRAVDQRAFERCELQFHLARVYIRTELIDVYMGAIIAAIRTLTAEPPRKIANGSLVTREGIGVVSHEVELVFHTISRFFQLRLCRPTARRFYR